MKFVCERCHTKYSITDEKVRGKVLKVRCKTCANVITVRETGATIDDADPGPNDVARARSAKVQAGPAVLPETALFSPGAPVAAPPRRPTRAPAPPPPVADKVEWFLAVDGAQTGPFPRARLCEKILALPRGADAHVWNDTFDTWKPPKDVPELSAELARRRRPPTPVPPRTARRPSGAVPAVGAASAAVVGATPAVAAATSAASHAAPMSGLEPTMPKAVHPVPAVSLKKNGTAGANGSSGGFSLGDLMGEPSGPASAFPAAAAPADGAVMLVPPVAAASSAAVAVPIGKTGSTTGSLAIAFGRGRQIKLAVAALAVVLVVCGVVGAWMLKKPAPPLAAAAPPVAATKQTSPDFAGLAENIAKEEAQAQAHPTPTGDGAKPVEAPAAPETHATVSVSSSTTRDKPGRKNRHAKGGGASTTPPPLGAASGPTLTVEERDAANRFGDNTGREVRLASSTGTSAHSTPAQADISRVVNNNRQGIQTCYQRALLRDNSLTHGKVNISVSIGLSGKVKRVSLDAPAQFRALEPCIRDVMSRWAFPPSSEEYETEFPVVLQGNQ